MPKPTRILFIRHGESAGNADFSVHETTPDHKIPLTDVGVAQAQAAGKKIAALLNGEKVAVYRSPFLRTRQTWQGVAEGIPECQIERVREDPRLREQEWGHLRPVAVADKIEQERNEFGTFFFRIPDGESGADVYDRCSGVLDTLYRDFEKPHFPPNVLFVTHGLTIRLLLMRWLHWTVEEFESLRNPRNCEIFEMRLQSNGKYQLTEPFPKRRTG